MSIAIFIVLQVVIFIFIYFYLHHIRKTLSQNETAKIREELNLLLIELNQTTDRNITLIEDRISTLKKLLEEADRKIRVLNQETSRKVVESTIYNRLGKLRDDASASINTQQDVLKVNNDQLESNNAASDRETEAKEAIPFIKLSHQSVTKNEIKEKVINLYKQGLDKELIANRLGVSLSEVELVIDLYQ
ncbi:MAG TPA: hypothetical protein P5519_03780 [Spirochaetia bacterium]|nr:hypothetical protein [Spirochaetales bacterium]HPD79671.1 hypothetical protein [Spirochaetales bacterium]HQK34389.1 hypothetical protein [Spirochaetales bacterium]HRS64990.1 hypothetical protein [Spirochaetia bacterium]HRV27444.1 hypothetical protein [Spirochaetia bacterium]